ncbi:MAG: hypothetical protein AABY40_01235 [Nanoarchaeota archaeon]
MVSLDSYLQSQGESFDSFGKWLAEATPEELLMGGVGAGMLICLYGKGDENISKYTHKVHDYLFSKGFSLKSTGFRSWRYSFDKNKFLVVSLGDSFSANMMFMTDFSHVDHLDVNYLQSANDASHIAAGMIQLIQEERISSRLLVDSLSGAKYDIKNHIMTPEGFRVYQP